MHKVIKIRNLDCAACAAELGEELQAIEGIEEAAVDFINQRVALTYLTQEAFSAAIDTISSFEEVEIIDENAPVKKESHAKELISIGVSAVFFVAALIIDLAFDLSNWISFGLYLAAFAAAGWSVFWEVCKNIPKAFKGGFHGGILLDENLLMLIAAVGAFALGQNSEGAIVMLLYQIGEYLQTLAVGSICNFARYAAAFNAVWHQHAIASGQRQIGRQRCPLVAALFFDNLHNQNLSFFDDVLNIAAMKQLSDFQELSLQLEIIFLIFFVVIVDGVVIIHISGILFIFANVFFFDSFRFGKFFFDGFVLGSGRFA